VRNAGGSAVNKALAAAFLPPNILPISFTVLLVNTGSKLVLIDAGTAGQVADTAGVMMANLAAAGIAPAAIDTVLISHFHPDHIDGLKTKDGDKVFANAEILVPEPEWTYWMDDAEMTRALDRIKVYFRNARRIFGDIGKEVRRFKPGAEVAPGITSIPAFGHTPGHCAFAIASGRQSMLVMSDVVRNPYLFARHPEWQPLFDAKADARPRRIRPHAGRGLPLSVPGLRSHRAERQSLRARAGGVATALERSPNGRRPALRLASDGRTAGNERLVARLRRATDGLHRRSRLHRHLLDVMTPMPGVTHVLHVFAHMSVVLLHRVLVGLDDLDGRGLGHLRCRSGRCGRGALRERRRGQHGCRDQHGCECLRHCFLPFMALRRDAGLALMSWIMPIRNERGLRGTDTRRSYR
jgi:glyoxylase-like metal-dependent hydrolase (beta-lactamase superfamily II)